LLVDTPDVANATLHLWAEIERLVGDGVIAAQGGREHGYSLHVVDGKLAFDVRIDGIVKRVQCGDKLPSACRVEAWLSDESLEIAVDGKVVAKVSSAGLIPVQPKDGLSIGFDDLSAAGDYQAPNPLNGTVRDLKIDTGADKK